MYPSDITEIRYSNIYNKKVVDDIKIASISDIHISDRTTLKELEFIIKLLYKNKPKYICILGDLIDSPTILNKNESKVLFFLNELSKITTVFLIIGNHDYINYYKGKMYEENYKNDYFEKIKNINNVNLLDDKVVILDDIALMGYTEKYNVYHKRNINSFYTDFSKKEQLYKMNTDTPNVALFHSSEPLRYLTNINLLSDYDLILTGHYHNGCVPSMLEKIWPVKNGGLITPAKEIFPKDVRGIEILKSGAYLIHNGGWVKMAENTPKYLHFLDKICNRQIDITTLTNKKEDIKVYTKKINNDY